MDGDVSFLFPMGDGERRATWVEQLMMLGFECWWMMYKEAIGRADEACLLP